MQRSLAGSVLLPLARTARAGPSMRSIVSSSALGHAYPRSCGESKSSLGQPQTRSPANNVENRTRLVSDHSSFSSRSICRYVDGLKDKSRSSGVQTEYEAEAQASDAGAQLKESEGSSRSSEHDMDHAKSPEEASIADHNRTTTTPPSPDASTPSRSDSQRDLLARLRSATASLPSFNGSTSQKSLTDALATATAHTHTLLARLRTKLTHLSTQYNTHTGYAAIEGLKTRIDELESSLSSARSLASTAKRTYLIAVQSRSASQRETNDLLSRKSSWSESDLGRYTELLRKEHALSREEAEAEKVLEKSEAQVQASFDELMKAVMVRYHEEQIWSDRMRGMSTYGSLVVAGLNAVLFVVAILLVEPYKRRRLAETFETRLVSAEEQSRELILASVEQFQRSLDALAATRTESEVQPASPPFIPPQVVELREAEEEPVVAVEDVPAPALSQRVARQEEERLVFASTVGVVVGAALSLLISACWT